MLEDKSGKSILDRINFKKLVMILGIVVVCANLFLVAVITAYLWFNTKRQYVEIANYSFNKAYDKYTEAYDDRMSSLNGRDVVQRQKESRRAFDYELKRDYGLSILTKDEQKKMIIITNEVRIEIPVRRKYVAPVESPKSELKPESKTESTNVDRLSLEFEFKSLNSQFPLDLKYKGRISSAFGVREAPQNLNTGGSGTTWHTGVDYFADVGTPIYADAEGRIASNTESSGLGNYCVIEHKNGLRSRFGHMSKVVVAYGSKIRAGQLIGYSGDSGKSNGPHLHYEIYAMIKGEPFYINPMNIFYN